MDNTRNETLSKPALSIIVPVYKVEDYLSECIDSLLNQSLNNVEIILVDDGSPDRCGEICDNYAENNPCIKVLHKINEGLLKARLSGLEIAEADYVGFLDSDDYVSEDYFERLLKNIKNTNSDMSCASITFFRGDMESELKIGFNGFFDAKRLISDFYPTFIYRYEKNTIELFPSFTPTKIYKKELIFNALSSVPEKLHIYEDIATTFYCVYNSKSIVCESANAGYFYRQREDSILHSFRHDYATDVVTLLHYLYDQASSSLDPKTIYKSLSYYNTGRTKLAFCAMPYTDATFSEVIEDIKLMFDDQIAIDTSVASEWLKKSSSFFEILDLLALKKRAFKLGVSLSLLRRIMKVLRR